MLTLSMVAVIGLLMSTTTALDIRRARAIFYEELEQRGVVLADALKDVLANPLYASDVDRLRDIAEVVQAQPDILYVQVFDRDGRLLVDTRQGQYPRGSVEQNVGLTAVRTGRSLAKPNGSVMEVAGPVTVGPDVIGGVYFDLSGESVEAEVRAITIERIWQTLALLVSGVAMSYLTAQYLARPVRQLAVATKRVADGEYEFSVDTGRSDEIGDLGRAFATMTRSLRESRDRLETRAGELRGANEQLRLQVAGANGHSWPLSALTESWRLGSPSGRRR